MTTQAVAQQANLDAAFKALASEHRREILRLLSASTPEPGKSCCSPQEVCACKLSDHLGLSASTISHHMSVLGNAGLVGARKDGLWTYYSLQRDALSDIARSLTAL